MESLQSYAIEGIVFTKENEHILQDSNNDQDFYMEEVKRLIEDLEQCLQGELDIFIIPRRGHGPISKEVIVAIGRLLFSVDESSLGYRKYIKGEGEPFLETIENLNLVYEMFGFESGEETEMCLIKGHLLMSSPYEIDFNSLRYD